MTKDIQATRTKANTGFWKPLLLTLAGFVLADTLATWIPGSFAAGIVVFFVGLIAYWIPPKPKMAFGRWMIRLVSYSALAFMIVALYRLFAKAIDAF